MTNYTDILAVLAGLAGVVMGFANIPQALKIYRHRSAAGVSAATYAILTFGYAILFAYGISIGQWPVIISSLFGLLGVGLVLAGIFRYEKRGRRHRGI